MTQLGRFELDEIYQGDCLALMAELPSRSVDAIITDPPYGIGSWSHTGGNSISQSEATEINLWDMKPSAEIFTECLRVSRVAVFWGGNHFVDILGNCHAPLIWDKAIRGMHFADGEMAWTNFYWGTLRIFNFPIASGDTKNHKVHPTQKPIAVMRWSILQAKVPEGGIILDPFCGSGTTCVAAKESGRHFLGFELNAEYCKIARQRVSGARVPLTGLVIP